MLARALSFSLLVVACGHASVATEPGPAVPVVEVVRQQEILTPLPLRVSLPRATGAEHVIVLFRPWGTRGWKQVELRRRGQMWSGDVSCREVSTVTGDTRYFFLALDAEGDIVGGSGSPNWPHVATIVGSLPDGPQGLQGASVPLRCHDVADCPPDFPGCPPYKMTRPACTTDRDCGEQRCGWDGYCGSPFAEVANGTPAVERTEDEELESAIRSVTQRYKRIAKAN